jgi:hypothetical protein
MNPAKKKGREPNAPLTQGTAKRPCGEVRRAAPDGRVLSGLASALKNSRFLSKAVAEATLNIRQFVLLFHFLLLLVL